MLFIKITTSLYDNFFFVQSTGDILANFFKKPHLFSTSNFFRLLHRTSLKVSWKTSSHHSTSLNQYLNLWVSLENYLISPFYTQNTSLRHSTLRFHTEWWWYQNCCWEESGSDSFGWIERCPSGGMTFKKGAFCMVAPPHHMPPGLRANYEFPSFF
jgi:hypothetical protein